MSRSHRFFSRTRRLRQGGIYVAVMGVAMIVSIVSLSAMHLTRLQLKAAVGVEGIASAQRLAQSAIELALAKINDDANWRSTFVHGQLEPTDAWEPLGGAEFRFVLLDQDGDLADDENDAVTLRGIGRSGESVQVATVMLEPHDAPLDCLEVSLCVNGNLEAEDWVYMETDQILSSNGNIQAGYGSSITGDTEAVGSITGWTSGSETTGISPRELPHEHVFDFYRFNGTWIDINALPVNGSGHPQITNVLLSPKVNPFGVTNPAGIYLIDCQGRNLQIKECRIVGTIVLFNTGASAALTGSVALEPATPNFPSLLVQGDICFLTKNVHISESAVGVNLNPVGTPYEENEDSDLNDAYPSIVQGLVYVSGTLKMPGDGECSCFRGIVVCEQILAGSQTMIEYDPAPFNYPPPGFAKGPEWRVVPASWQRESY